MDAEALAPPSLVAAVNAEEAVSAASSLYLSHRLQRDMISCMMVAMRGRETFMDDRKLRIASDGEGFGEGLGKGAGGVTESAWLSRVERRVVDVEGGGGGGGGGGAGVEGVVVVVVREEDEERCGVISSLEGGWKTTVRYIAAMAMRWGGYMRHRLDRYVSLMINLGVGV